MKTKLDPKDAQDAYDQFYIGESQNGSFCADMLGVSMYVLTSAWGKLKVRVRTREEERQAAKQRGQRWEWAGEEDAPAEALDPVGAALADWEGRGDPLEDVPPLEVGDSVAFQIQGDQVFDVQHKPAEPETSKETYLSEENDDLADPGPGRRAIEADQFSELLGKIKGNAPAKANGHSPQILAVVNMRVENEEYFHPIIGDFDRLVDRLCARGLPAKKAVKVALKAAELARMGVEPSKIG